MYAPRAHLRRARALRPHYSSSSSSSSSSSYYYYYYYYIGFEFGRSHTLHTVSRKFPHHHHHYYYRGFECGRSQTWHSTQSLGSSFPVTSPSLLLQRLWVWKIPNVTLHPVSGKQFPRHITIIIITEALSLEDPKRDTPPSLWEAVSPSHHHHYYYRGFEFGRSQTWHSTQSLGSSFPVTSPSLLLQRLWVWKIPNVTLHPVSGKQFPRHITIIIITEALSLEDPKRDTPPSLWEAVSPSHHHHHHYYYRGFECGRSQTLHPVSRKQFPHHHHYYYRGFECGRSQTLHPVSGKFPRTLPIRRQTLVPSGCVVAHCWDNQLHLKRWHRVSVVACKAVGSGLRTQAKNKTRKTSFAHSLARGLSQNDRVGPSVLSIRTLRIQTSKEQQKQDLASATVWHSCTELDTEVNQGLNPRPPHPLFPKRSKKWVVAESQKWPSV